MVLDALGSETVAAFETSQTATEIIGSIDSENLEYSDSDCTCLGGLCDSKVISRATLEM